MPKPKPISKPNFKARFRVITSTKAHLIRILDILWTCFKAQDQEGSSRTSLEAFQGELVKVGAIRLAGSSRELALLTRFLFLKSYFEFWTILKLHFWFFVAF